MHRSVLGSISPDSFLKEYWQKKPLLVRGAFPGGLDYVDGDTLAGLACQDGIESRLVLEHGDSPWQTVHGPFDEAVFSRLPPTHWTLLVQAVDRLLPDVARLRQAFPFLPNWRVDDIMISYAPDHGSVGPHNDNYDVFLIQGAGRRRWDIHAQIRPDAAFIPDLDLKILASFEPELSFVLEPGDMLYLPPQLAHHGIAIGDSLTYSVGFRAPTQKEMLLSFAQFLSQSEEAERFYADPDLQARSEPGLILEAERERLRALMLDAIASGPSFERWIGGFLTEPRTYHEAAEESLEADGLLAALPETLVRAEGGRFAYYLDQGKLYFAVEGENLVLSPVLEDLAALLCRQDSIARHELLAFQKLEGFSALLQHLWNHGNLRNAEEEEDEQ